MAKLSSVNREAKRVATVKKFAAKRAELKALIGDQTRSNLLRVSTETVEGRAYFTELRYSARV